MEPKHAALFALTSIIYTLIDEGITRDSSLEEVNDILRIEMEDDGYKSIEAFQEDWDRFHQLSDFNLKLLEL